MPQEYPSSIPEIALKDLDEINQERSHAFKKRLQSRGIDLKLSDEELHAFLVDIDFDTSVCDLLTMSSMTKRVLSAESRNAIMMPAGEVSRLMRVASSREFADLDHVATLRACYLFYGMTKQVEAGEVRREKLVRVLTSYLVYGAGDLAMKFNIDMPEAWEAYAVRHKINQALQRIPSPTRTAEAQEIITESEAEIIIETVDEDSSVSDVTRTLAATAVHFDSIQEEALVKLFELYPDPEAYAEKLLSIDKMEEILKGELDAKL